MKLDVLAIGAHPDDVELSAAGTLLKLKASGKKVGIVDLTRGELGTRGTAELRTEEANNASKILGIDMRSQLDLGDGKLDNQCDRKREVIKVIRAHQPDVLLLNALHDRHIDHGNAALLATEAAFLSGLIKIETEVLGSKQQAWRPKLILHYIQDYYMQPSLVVDVTPFKDIKMQAIQAYSSQFFNPNSPEPATPISSNDFLHFLEARMREMGRWIGATYGEGFVSKTPLSIETCTKYFCV